MSQTLSLIHAYLVHTVIKFLINWNSFWKSCQGLNFHYKHICSPLWPCQHDEIPLVFGFWLFPPPPARISHTCLHTSHKVHTSQRQWLSTTFISWIHWSQISRVRKNCKKSAGDDSFISSKWLFPVCCCKYS